MGRCPDAARQSAGAVVPLVVAATINRPRVRYGRYVLAIGLVIAATSLLGMGTAKLALELDRSMSPRTATLPNLVERRRLSMAESRPGAGLEQSVSVSSERGSLVPSATTIGIMPAESGLHAPTLANALDEAESLAAKPITRLSVAKAPPLAVLRRAQRLRLAAADSARRRVREASLDANAVFRRNFAALAGFDN